MKAFLLWPFFTFQVVAAPVFEAGNYTCVEGNEESICDQIVQVRIRDNQATLIAIEYSGWCGSQGPYRYICDEKSCSDGHIKVTPLSQTTYYWENLDYNFHCKFEKTPNSF